MHQPTNSRCTQDAEASDSHQEALLSQLTSDQPPDSSAPESASAPTQSEGQDNGWGEHADWDFQDVPLDSPRSSSKSAKSSHRSPAKSQTAKAQQPAAQQPAAQHSAPKHEFHDHGGSSISEREVAALQRENDTLTRRLERVEAVSLSQPSTGHKTDPCICHCFICTMQYYCTHHCTQSIVQRHVLTLQCVHTHSTFVLQATSQTETHASKSARNEPECKHPSVRLLLSCDSVQLA